MASLSANHVSKASTKLTLRRWQTDCSCAASLRLRHQQAQSKRLLREKCLAQCFVPILLCIRRVFHGRDECVDAWTHGRDVFNC